MAGIDNSLNGELRKYDSGYINDYSNRLFGAPFQLLDSVDKRFPDINPNLGNEYLRNFILNSPILYIRPGMPKYTGNVSSSSLSELVRNIYSDVVDQASSIGLGEAAWRTIGSTLIFGSGSKLQGRMFGFRETYYEYIQNVNYMCRSVATYMNLIDGTEFPDGCYVFGNQWRSFDTIDWQDYRIGSQGNTTPTEQLSGYIGVLGDSFWGSVSPIVGFLNGLFTDKKISEEVRSALQQSSATSILGQINSKISSVEFMVEPIEFTETLSNQTSPSFIEGMIDGITQGVGTEIGWITNSSADTGVIGNLTDFLGDSMQSVSQVLGELVQPISGGFTRNLFSGAIAAIKGQKMIYPNIYKSSESHMDYQFSITLTTPYGDPYNYYMNIVVPLLHLIALVSPRLISSNTTASPFLVQAYIPGMCTCQLGIIRDMTIIKNPTTKHVSVNGFPLTVKVQFTIEELYNAMAISPANDPASFLYNETLNDYLCNLSGLSPSLETYASQRQAKFQAVGRYFDQWLFIQDPINNIIEGVENFVRPGNSY